MLSRNKILLYCLAMCICSSCLVYWLVERQQKKIGVIDAVKLFDTFNMTKELDKQAKERLQELGKQVDSVGNKLQIAKATHNDDELQKLTETYVSMKNSLQSEFETSNRDINAQVWKRLNPMLDEFGKKSGVHLIIGANGMGSVLYNDSFYDLTSNAINFVNKKYEDGN